MGQLASARLETLSKKSTSRLLVARVVLVIAAVAVPGLHVVIVVVVIEYVGAFVRDRGGCAHAVFSQCGGDLYTVALCFRLSG